MADSPNCGDIGITTVDDVSCVDTAGDAVDSVGDGCDW